VVRKIDLERKRKGVEIVGEMRGKDINLTITAGADSIREIKVLKEDGSIYPMENIGVEGRILGMREEGDGEEMECKVTEGGLIEVRFPGKEEGRYIFAVDGVSDDGQRERIIEGYVGYEGPAMKEVGNEEGAELLVYMDGERRKALFGRNMAWVGMYKASQEVAEQVKEVDKKLEKAEALDKAFSEKMSDFVQPNEATGTWVVGGVDTGQPYKGADGKDADVIKRYEISSIEELPSAGNNGAFYYVKQAATRATGWVRLTTSPGPVGAYVMSIAGVSIYCPSDMSVESIAAAINAAQRYVTASVRESDSTYIDLESTVLGELGNAVSLTLGENLNNQQISGASMTGGKDEGYLPYVWLEKAGGGSWQAVSTTPEKIAVDVATASKYGTVMLSHSVSTAEGWKVPTNQAVYNHVSTELQGKVNQEELDIYATKDEISTLATKQEIEGLATKEELEEISVQVPQNVVSSAFGKKIVELSETEYSLLESYDEDTYYFTFAD
jgi:hypothetical protein